MNAATDPMIQERLSLERTVMSNQRTFLSFLRTSMYFLVAGLSIRSLLGMKDDLIIHIVLYVISGILLIIGVVLYLRFRQKCHTMRKHLGEINGDIQLKGKVFQTMDLED